MSPNERLLRRRLRTLLDALGVYADMRMFGDPDEDQNDDGDSRCGLRLDNAVTKAQEALRLTAPSTPPNRRPA